MNLDLSCVDVPAYLAGLGLNVQAGLTEARFSCPLPAHAFGDKNPSAYMNLHSTAWICFSCGHRGNAITLLADLYGVSYAQARQWIAEKWAPHYAEIENLQEYLLRSFNEQERAEENPYLPQPEIPQEFLEGRRVDWYAVAAAGEQAPPALRYLISRGLSPDTLRDFGAIYDPISDRPCIAAHDERGRLVGFKGRAWHDEMIPKYLIIGDSDRSIQIHGQRYGFAPYDASKIVFALDRADISSGTLLVVEGELNVMSLHQMGFRNAIGPSGSTLSERFVDLVAERCEEIVLLFDSDLKSETSAATARIKILTAVEQFDSRVRIKVCPDHAADPNEMTREQVESLLAAAVPSISYRVLHLAA